MQGKETMDTNEEAVVFQDGYLIAKKIPATGLPPTQPRTNADAEQQRLASIQLVKDYASKIYETAKKYNVTPESIAGAILWEALENPYPSNRPEILRPNAAGKIHPINWNVLRPQEWASGVPLSEAEKVEQEGRVPPLFETQYLPEGWVNRTFSQTLEIGNPAGAVQARILKLQDPNWAITYAGAIMDRAAEIYQEKLGINIRKDTGLLTTLYHLGEPEYYAGITLEKRQNVQQENQQDKVSGKEGPPIPLTIPKVPPREMGEWVNNNLDWIRSLLQEGLKQKQHSELEQNTSQIAQQPTTGEPTANNNVVWFKQQLLAIREEHPLPNFEAQSIISRERHNDFMQRIEVIQTNRTADANQFNELLTWQPPPILTSDQLRAEIAHEAYETEHAVDNMLAQQFSQIQARANVQDNSLELVRRPNTDTSS
jgi:hypothetical protein